MSELLGPAHTALLCKICRKGVPRTFHWGVKTEEPKAESGGGSWGGGSNPLLTN